MKDIGTFLKQKRDEKSISQKEFATMLNVTTTTVNKYLNNKCSMSIETFIESARILDFSVDEFFELVPHLDNPLPSKSERHIIDRLRLLNKQSYYKAIKLINTMLDMIIPQHKNT